MAVLQKYVKEFIVRCHAHDDVPSRIVKAVAEQFDGLVVSKQQVMLYNPTLPSGAALRPALRKLFHSERERFINTLKEQPLAHKAVRLHILNAERVKATDEGDSKSVLTAVKLAAEEMDGMDWDRDAGDK